MTPTSQINHCTAIYPNTLGIILFQGSYQCEEAQREEDHMLLYESNIKIVMKQIIKSLILTSDFLLSQDVTQSLFILTWKTRVSLFGPLVLAYHNLSQLVIASQTPRSGRDPRIYVQAAGEMPWLEYPARNRYDNSISTSPV